MNGTIGSPHGRQAMREYYNGHPLFPLTGAQQWRRTNGWHVRIYMIKVYHITLLDLHDKGIPYYITRST